MSIGTVLGILLLFFVVIVLALIAGFAVSEQGKPRKTEEPHPNDIGTRFE